MDKSTKKELSELLLIFLLIMICLFFYMLGRQDGENSTHLEYCKKAHFQDLKKNKGSYVEWVNKTCYYKLVYKTEK